ncbi:MAG TPA: type II secretion system secretin GspD [Polyangiales bacterium]
MPPFSRVKLKRLALVVALCVVGAEARGGRVLAQEPEGAPAPPAEPAPTPAQPRGPSEPIRINKRAGRNVPRRGEGPAAQTARAAEEAPIADAPQLPRFETGIEFQPTSPGERITFNLEDAELTDLVRLISSITGKAFIIPNKTRQVKATVYAPNKVTAAEAYRAFLSILELNGLSLVPSGRYLKIVESQGVETKTIPLMINQNVPAEDRFMTSITRVNYVSAEDVATLLTRFKSAEGNVTAYAPTNTIIVTDTGSNIRRMQRVLKAIDVERGGEQLWIEPVHHATASEMAARLIEIFPLASSDPAKKATQAVPPPASGQTKPMTIGDQGGGFRVTNILPDERTNSLIIVATQTAYLRILELIRRLDVPLTGDGGVHVHPLQHSDAEEVAKTLTTLIGGTTKKSQGAKTPGAAQSPDAVFDGNIAVTAYEPTNSLVITSSLHDYAALKAVIDRLDSERRQVFIEAVVVNLDVTSNRTFGISYFTGVPDVPTEGSVGVLGYQNSLGSIQQGIAGIAGAVTAAGGADALTGLALGIQGPAIQGGPAGLTIPSFGMALSAMATAGDSDVLATPHLLALNNEEAEINIGQNVPLQASVAGSGLGALGGLGLGAMGAAGAAGAAANPLAGLGGLGAMGGGLGFGAPPRGDVGTRIRVTPHINESDEIRLELEEEISDVGAPVAGSNVGAVPINRRTAKTQLVVRDQQTVVIGGLMRDAITTTNSKIPLLGDIPVIGLLFRKKTTTKSKQNLLLFMTPYIVRTQADLRAIYERKMRERQEFLDRYFVFGTHDYHPTVDYARTRGLVGEMMKQIDTIKQEKALADKLAKAPTGGHTASIPVGTASAATPELEDDDVVIEGGSPAPLPPPPKPEEVTPTPAPAAPNVNALPPSAPAPAPGGR